ncbi:ribosome silencing factor [Desulfocapsa sp. AH-315-G09]|uniref:Ribosomal silencing factor RsfS n=1 Tax=Desulfotalea psychrophila TaxID=84980 RepID=A0ABS3AT67_9BACT|nr:ribosome silencing factor [Desulfocapsa sp.]MBN4065464.1 ribosome silencing factor [Desulfocapsa sp. AH-315-G09]MBN4067966.1 ribosome silencing factor [Desulfotalea psychrophila]
MKKLKKELHEKSSLELVTICAKAALDTKAEDLIVLDVQGISSFTDYFIIMSGRSSRHVQGLAEAMEKAMRSKRISAAKAEGIKEGMWVLLDFDDVVVHIFYHEQRSFYDLEGLWHDAPRVEINES